MNKNLRGYSFQSVDCQASVPGDWQGLNGKGKGKGEIAMLTKEQALRCDRFHLGGCTRVIGPRGGVTEKIEEWRRNGTTKTWKTRPDDWEIPVKYGMYDYGRISHREAYDFHAPEDCPLRDPEFVSRDERKG